MQPNWQLFALGSAFFAGLTAIFGKLGVLEINSNLATFIRTVVIILMIASVITFRQEWKTPTAIPFNNWIFLILSALATGLSWLCYYRALQLGTVSKVVSVDKLSIVFAILLSLIFLHEKFNWGTALGCGLVVAGSFVMILFG